MKRIEHRDESENEGRWWRLDFAMVLVLLILATLLMIVTFEFWHSHFGSH
jgi:hypothetical protein